MDAMMYDNFQEHCDYEANAQYDYVSEAYAATALDPYYEGYCDYCFECEAHGDEPEDFATWKAGLWQVRAEPTPLTWSSDTAIPF